jgi:hypothetical protein
MSKNGIILLIHHRQELLNLVVNNQWLYEILYTEPLFPKEK